MKRITSNEDLGHTYPCNIVDINPYCQVTRRGYNMSCEECRKVNRNGPWWHQFLQQDKKVQLWK